MQDAKLQSCNYQLHVLQYTYGIYIKKNNSAVMFKYFIINVFNYTFNVMIIFGIVLTVLEKII